MCIAITTLLGVYAVQAGNAVSWQWSTGMSVQALLTLGVEAALPNGLRRSYGCPCVRL